MDRVSDERLAELIDMEEIDAGWHAPGSRHEDIVFALQELAQRRAQKCKICRWCDYHGSSIMVGSKYNPTEEMPSPMESKALSLCVLWGFMMDDGQIDDMGCRKGESEPPKEE